MCQPKLIIILDNRSDFHCETKLAPLFRLLVLADIVDESIVELSDFDGWIRCEHVARLELLLGKTVRAKCIK